MNKILNRASQYFNAALYGNIKWGWHYKSIGSKIIIGDDIFWMKVSCYESFYKMKDSIKRLQSATLLPHIINKPEVLDFLIWKDGCYYLAIIMSYIREPTLANGPVLKDYISIDQIWLTSLSRQLQALSDFHSDYINCSNELLKRRIVERFGLNAPTHIANWCTIHGDVHWSNLTNKTPFILDWEGCGRGPRSLDISLLYCFSLLQPTICIKIKESFNSTLNEQDGRVCQLFCCSELLRMNELYGDYPELSKPLKDLANKLLK